MLQKIALEEHFVIPSFIGGMGPSGVWDPGEWQYIQERIADTADRRLNEMDRFGVEREVLSLASNGIQEELDRTRAVDRAIEANDALARIVAAHPDRYSGFAALPMQDPTAAVRELERTVREYGFKGALVNGYSNIDNLETALYYDEPQYLPFWEQLEVLQVPLYLHPRTPLPTQRRIYAGRSELMAAPWGFAVETGTHALRLITSGLFDRYPGATVILGHLGELLPFAVDRFDRRLAHIRPGVKLKKTGVEYLRDHFYVTTSGNFHTPSLLFTIQQLGVDRVLFSIDYPFEQVQEAAEWLESVPLEDEQKRKIARTNALRALRL